MDIKPGSPYDINGACFNADMYVKKVLKVKKESIVNMYHFSISYDSPIIILTVKNKIFIVITNHRKPNFCSKLKHIPHST